MFPDQVLDSPIISRRLAAEARFDSERGSPEKGHYWVLACLPSTKSTVVRQNYTSHEDFQALAVGYNQDPHPVQKTFANELLQSLNHHVGNGGGWLVGFTHPPASHELIKTDGDNAWGRLICIWLDEDGDPQFTYESDHPFFHMYQQGIQYYTQQAWDSWASWKKIMRDDLDLKAGQTYKRALGEANPVTGEKF